MKPNDTGMINFKRSYVPPHKLLPGAPINELCTNQLFARLQVGGWQARGGEAAGGWVAS